MELNQQSVAMKDRIREAREALGLSQNEFARRAGVNHPTFHKIEAGQRTDVSAAVLLKIARALGTTVEALLGPDVPWPASARPQNVTSLDDQKRLRDLEEKVDFLLEQLGKLTGGQE